MNKVGIWRNWAEVDRLFLKQALLALKLQVDGFPNISYSEMVIGNIERRLEIPLKDSSDKATQ